MGRHRGDWLTSASGLRYRFSSYRPGMTRLHAPTPGAPLAVAAQGFAEPKPRGSGHARAPAPADLPDPGAAAGLGVGGGARALRAGVQQAGPLRPRRAGPRGVEPQRALAAAAGRVLGARGRADGGRRLAAAALADARVRARPLGHGDRQEERAARRGHRRRRHRTRARRRPVRSRRIWSRSRAGARARGGTAATPSGWPRRCGRRAC